MFADDASGSLLVFTEYTEINRINDLVDLLNELIEDENNSISNDTILSEIDVDEHRILDIVSTHNKLIEELCDDKDVEQIIKDKLNKLEVWLV